MRIYLASRLSRIKELQYYREQLEAKGHTVTSRWLNGDHVAAADDREERGRFAVEDLQDIESARMFIHFGEPEGTYTHGGRRVELGWALRSVGVRVINIGPSENIFHDHPEVEQFATWEDCLTLF